MRAFVFGGLLAASLVAAGCGGPVEQEESPELGTQKASLPDCSVSPDNLRNYYSDPGHTNLIGQFGCCSGGLYNWGIKSSQYIDFNASC